MSGGRSFAKPYYSLSDNTTVANGGTFSGQGVAFITVQVTGVVTNDIVQIQASNDGVGWAQIGDDITADGVYAVERGAVYYRAIRSDITGAGTVDAVFAGG